MPLLHCRQMTAAHACHFGKTFLRKAEFLPPFSKPSARLREGRRTRCGRDHSLYVAHRSGRSKAAILTPIVDLLTARNREGYSSRMNARPAYGAFADWSSKRMRRRDRSVSVRAFNQMVRRLLIARCIAPKWDLWLATHTVTITRFIRGRDEPPTLRRPLYLRHRVIVLRRDAV